ncbi:MAG: HD domain-containing protein [Thermoleophilaceae bacterium]|nr:HD domain-containing protein [Thermoleophilaceae bacterium]
MTDVEQGRTEVEQLRAQLLEEGRAATAKEDQLERYAADLRETFKQERARTQELEASYVATVRALTNAVEARDAYTGRHAERVAAYGLELAGRVDGALLEDPQTEYGFLLHDVGKVAIPDAILHKPEPLSPEERELMRRHPVVGAEIVGGIGFLSGAVEVVRHHHERWDGGGYPDGLVGEQIPLVARVFSVVDALDAITTDRPFRAHSPLEVAREIIRREAGGQFDPLVVRRFEDVPDATLEDIAREVSSPRVG